MYVLTTGLRIGKKLMKNYSNNKESTLLIY